MTNGGAFFGNFWIFIFILLFLVPQFQRTMRNIARQNKLKEIAKKRGSQVITLIHRQETIAFLGIPLTRYIDIDDSEEVLRAIRQAPKDASIDLIVHTPGGIALAATQIALALKDHPGKTTVFVPHYAMSGGTLIALAADEICMDEHAVLGPVDPQLGDQTGMWPATTVLKITEKKDINEIDDKTLIMAEESKKAIDQMNNLVRELVENKMSDKEIEKIIEVLVSGKYTHDYPITAKEAKKLLGACIMDDFPKEIYELMRLYKMDIMPRRPGVEFVPIMPKKVR